MWVRLVPITHTSGHLRLLWGRCPYRSMYTTYALGSPNTSNSKWSIWHSKWLPPNPAWFFFWECRGNFTSLFSVKTQSRFNLPVFSLPYVIYINYTSEKLRISEPVVLDKHVSQNQNIMSQVLLEKSAGSRVEVTKEGECLACPGKTWGESRESFTAETGSWMWKGKLVFTTKTSSTGIIIGYDFSVNIYTRPRVFKV